MKKYSIKALNSLLADGADLYLSDAEINKATGIWRRTQQQMGIPLAPETRHKISEALKDRHLSAETKAKISASLKKRHQSHPKVSVA
ncbi:NUMOD3 domain-containing DNA-binding protein [Comamonas suwonensis]|jgi:hypothetical protein|uniref:Nuclease associated modular domain-containing protein n=1 Tax=Comamonas suwonensis TaxID=2606214 RepID=A0A843B4S9_9BURK|nr:NUMOD3 domain-containing DNA-binding protein [Comamonas suwonensis]MBI1625781.1 hypothetical protein [Comamonas suwonensis]